GPGGPGPVDPDRVRAEGRGARGHAARARGEQVVAEPPPHAPAARPVQAPAATQLPGYPFSMVPPGALTVDAGRFQFKSDADEAGVNETLRGAKRWEPDLADPITAWQGNDGKLYVVNGHQRTGLAKRME